jgi:ferritin-like metal-binding protein YciE
MEINSLSEVLVEELGQVFSAEQQLLEAVPVLAKAAHSYSLREAFENHLEETRQHVDRLEQAFADLGVRFVPSKTCQAMRGILDDSAGIIDATGDSVAIDAALIGLGQRIEHFEIACYGSAQALAGELGHNNVSSLLNQTLSEESRANKLLTKLAAGGLLSSGINHLAAQRSESDAGAAEDPAHGVTEEPAHA